MIPENVLQIQAVAARRQPNRFIFPYISDSTISTFANKISIKIICGFYIIF